VLPPDINESFEDFTVVAGGARGKEDIRFGLTTIKNFGQGIAHEIIEERKAHGPYKSIEDVLRRIKSRNLNKKSLESLIKAGAFDAFEDRGTLFGNLEELLTFHKEAAQDSTAQDSLFGNALDNGLTLKKVAPISDDQKLSWERELLGLFVSGNPLDKFREQFEKRDTSITKIKADPKEDALVVIAGLLEDIRVIRTKKGDEMAFARVADFDDSMEIVFFPSIFKRYKQALEVDTCLAIKGKVSMRNGEVSVIADKMKLLR
jgi:DNA polymerase III subunit alpha